MKIDWNFNTEDWCFECSSGFAGYRNTITDEWIYSKDYNDRINILNEFKAFKKMLEEMNYYEAFSSMFISLFQPQDEVAEIEFMKFKEFGFSIYKEGND